jgi:hypothetical protein
VHRPAIQAVIFIDRKIGAIWKKRKPRPTQRGRPGLQGAVWTPHRGASQLALSLHARNPYYYYYYYYYVERAEIAASIKLYELPFPSETY